MNSRKFETALSLLVNAVEQHPGGVCKIVWYATEMVMADRELEPRGLPKPNKDK